jgi:hypothetical protein
MPDFEAILRTKQKVEARLRSLPSVHAVGIGHKVVNGTTFDEIVITVFVAEKKPSSALASGELVPAEIEGVRTDVVEMPLPRLHFAANPNDLTFEISADQQSISFFGKNTPGEGLVIAVDFTATTNAVAGNFSVAYETEPHDTREDIAKKIAKQFNQGTIVTHVTASSSLTSVLVHPNPGTTVNLTNCKITARDDAKYFKDWMRGGIQIQPGGADELITSGTVGCLATTPPTAQFPQGMVVGVTCHHIVAPVGRDSTNLTVTKQGTVVTLGVDSNPIRPNTVVRITFPEVGSRPSATAYYETVKNDTLTNIVDKVSGAVNHLPLGPDVKAQPGPNTVTITGADFIAAAFGPSAEDPRADLKASIDGRPSPSAAR